MDSQAGPKKADQDGKVGRAFRAAKMSSVGIEMAVATCIGWGLGVWADSELGSSPYGMLVGLAFGVAAGFKGVFRAAEEAKRIAMESKQ